MGSFYTIPKAILYLLKGDYNSEALILHQSWRRSGTPNEELLTSKSKTIRGSIAAPAFNTGELHRFYIGIMENQMEKKMEMETGII